LTSKTTNKFAPEVRERAVRIVLDHERDLALRVEVRRVFDANFRVYSVRKVWRQLRRDGFDVARCTVARLMRAMGLAGVIRGKPVRTTISDRSAPCPRDHSLPRGPWRSFEAVEYATLEWVDGLNHRRLLEPIGDIPPAEPEEQYDDMIQQQPMAA